MFKRQSKKKEPPNAKKYGMPLYGAAWPPGEYFFVCGGGGHGLVNRIVTAKYDKGQCYEQAGEYQLGTQCPMRMAVAPSGTTLLVANSDGGLRRFQLDLRSRVPALIEVSAAFKERFSVLGDEVKAISFDQAGSHVALGFNTGAVKVLEYPAMKVVRQWSLPDEVKDLDLKFVRRSIAASDRLLLATITEGGDCSVWDVDKGAAESLAPPKLQGPMKFSRCRWHPDHTKVGCLFAVAQQGRDAAYIVAYKVAGGNWGEVHRVFLEKGPCSSMDISRSGRYLAAGQSSASLRVFTTDTLELVKMEQQVNMGIYITAVAFSADERAVIAVAGDATAYVMDLPLPCPRSRGSSVLTTLFLMFLLVGLAMLSFILLPAQFTPQSVAPLQHYFRRVPQVQQMAQYVEGILQQPVNGAARGPGGWGAATLGVGQQQQQQQQQVRAAWGDREL